MRRVARRWVELSTGARPEPFARTFARLWAAPAAALVLGERQEVNRDS